MSQFCFPVHTSKVFFKKKRTNAYFSACSSSAFALAVSHFSGLFFSFLHSSSSSSLLSRVSCSVVRRKKERESSLSSFLPSFLCSLHFPSLFSPFSPLFFCFFLSEANPLLMRRIRADIPFLFVFLLLRGGYVVGVMGRKEKGIMFRKKEEKKGKNIPFWWNMENRN